MNLDELMAVWRSQDAAPLHDMNKTLLDQALRQEQAELEKLWRWDRPGGYFGCAALLIAAGTNLTIMIARKDEGVLIAWDYVVGVVGVAAAIIVTVATFALLRSRQAREQGFGDSLRDHLRRRLAQLDDAETVDRRIGLITLPAALICVFAIPIGMKRIAHVPVPYSELGLPSLNWTVLILGLLCLELFRWGPRRERRKNLPRKRQLEALLKELDGQ